MRDTKKERRLAPPLRVEVLELRLRKTADLPRPFQLRPVPQHSAPGLRSRDFYSRLIYRRLPAPALPTCVCLAARFRGSRPFRRPGRSGLRLPFPRTFHHRSAFRFLPYSSSRCFRSSAFPSSRCFQPPGLLRLSPPGVYLKGSRLPFESPFLARPGFLQSPVRATCSVPSEHSVPSSATLHIAFRRVGRPAGGFCLTGGSGYTREFYIVKRVLNRVTG